MEELKQVTAKDTMKIDPLFFEQKDNTTIAWLASAGFLINSQGTIILIDPVLMTKAEDDEISEAGLKLKIPYPIRATEVTKVDYVLYSHPDNDHLGEDTAVVLAKLNPTFIGPHTVFNKLSYLGVNPNNIITCRTYDTIEIGDIKIEITPADHPWQLSDPKTKGKPFRKEDCCGFIITTIDGRYYFPGDTRLMEEHLYIKDIDVLALDVSLDNYHLKDGAVVLANHLQNALLIPVHYGTYSAPGKAAHAGDPNDVLSKVDNSERRSRILAPGEPLIMKNKKEVIRK